MKNLKLFTTLILILLSSISIRGNELDWEIRGGLAYFEPEVTGHQVLIGNAPLPNARLTLDSFNSPVLFIKRRLTNSWSVETVLGPPVKTDINLNSSLFTKEISAANLTLLPFMLIANYSPASLHWGNLHPYLGIGMTYIKVSDSKLTPSIIALAGPAAEPEVAKLKITDQKRLLLQIGFDYQLNANWNINAAVLHFKGDTQINGQLGSMVPLSATVNYDPIIFGLTLGYKF